MLDLLSVLRKSIKYTWYGCLVFGTAHVIGATPNNTGQSGYINMPSASVEADGTFMMGYSYDSPYGNMWVTSTFLPFLQMTGRYMSIEGIPGFTNASNAYGSGYGRYKDKSVDLKVKLWDETAWLPSVAVGQYDLFGTELFNGTYIVATKTFGSSKNLEASIGYGKKRPDGLFGGVRWTPDSLPNWAMVAEYDATNYANDFGAAQTFAGQRSKGPAVGLEYRWGWLGVQVARQKNVNSINAYVTIPLSQREFIPKIYEPAYFQQKGAWSRPSINEWQQDASHGNALVQALVKQDYKNVRLELKGSTLYLSLTNSRISNMGRAVGRATRTALAFAPVGITGIHVTYTKNEQPIATYEFFDLDKLSDYLDGKINRQAFLDAVLVRYPNQDDVIHDNQEGMLAGVKDDAGLDVLVGQEGHIVQLKSQDSEANRFQVVPKLSFLFNDPSGALRYNVSALALYDKRLDEGLYLNGELGLSILDTISGVTQPSNSLLPHVRSDVADYARGDRLRLQKLMLNKYLTPDERWYARLSAGIYEEMFRGVGGQVLYLPNDSRWAADLSIDFLQQRDYTGWFGKRDYNTVTALGALHYQLPYGITATARVGRFLAKDVGVRTELKRRFLSGVEIGVWYTRTNGKDTTTPGSVASPYNDKGVFLSIPLGRMLPTDSQGTSGFSLAPWTRDVGQMVASPGDLYEMMESPRRDMTTADGLGNFAERPDERNHPAVMPPEQTFDNPMPEIRTRLDDTSSALPSASDVVQGAALGAGAVLVASLSDKKIDQFMKNHAGSSLLRTWGNVGNVLPYALVGAAGATVAFGDDRLRNTGLIALQSVALAAGVGEGAKYLVDRARPDEEQGPWSQQASGQPRSNASFPSTHAAVTFAAVTPFAKEYDAPWLYGLAAVGAMGRVANRQHWFSDVVAGGLLGYASGTWFWHAQRYDGKPSVSITPGPKALNVSWQKSY